jgi:hypothetical protein
LQGSVCCHSYIVVEAEAHQLLRLSMMTWRPHNGKGSSHLTMHNSLYRLLPRQ